MSLEKNDNVCPDLEGSALNTQCGESSMMDSFPIYREEEEMVSNVAVGVTSPFFNIQSLTADEGHSSAEFLPLEEASADDEDDVNNSYVATDGEPEYLSLNQENLAHFESSVQRGKVPLRTDVVGNTHIGGRAPRLKRKETRPMKKHSTNVNDKAACEDTPLDSGINSPCQNYVDTVSISEITNHVTQGSEMNKDFTTVSPITRNSQRPSGCDHDNANSINNNSKTANLSNFENASMTFTVTLSARDPNEMLNEKNLQLHMQTLNNGEVGCLKTDTIPNTLPSKSAPLWLSRGEGNTNHNNEGNINNFTSLCCEPSDMLLGSETMSTEFSQQRNASLTNATVEEFWSMDTNRATEPSLSYNEHTLTQINNLASLNKKSLRKLRQQIESGKVPLRPEVLSGLSGVAPRLKRVAKKSASTFVEVPSEELSNPITFKSIPAKPASLSTSSPEGGRIAFRTNCLKLRSPPLGGLISDTAGLSMCSVSVEASGRERHAETTSANDFSSTDHDAHEREEAEAEDAEAGNEDSLFLPYGLATVQEEIGSLNLRVKALAQDLDASRQGQDKLVRQVAAMCEEMRTGLQNLQPAPLDDLQRCIVSLQGQLEAMRALVMDSHGGRADSRHSDRGSRSFAKDASRIRVYIKLDLRDRPAASDSAHPHLSTPPSSEDLIFVLTADPKDHVRDLKEKFLKRLEENKLLPKENPISAANTLLFMDEKVLFDTDLLGYDLRMNSAPANEYTLTLRRRT